MNKVEQQTQGELIEELIEELTARAQWYFPGFGSRMCSIGNSLEHYSREYLPGYYKLRALVAMDEVDGVYNIIPFEEVSDSQDYDLLISVKYYLYKLRLEVENILDGDGNFENFYEIRDTIMSLGDELRDRLNMILLQVREFQGYESYHLRDVDMLGQIRQTIK